MITNGRQYAITKAQIARLAAALAQAEAQRPTLHPRAAKAMREGIESQLEDLQSEIADYEKLRAGQVTSIVAESILDLAQALIKARIAGNWTHKELAERLDLPEQQGQRYEARLYEGVPVERLQAVADALKVRVREVITLDRCRQRLRWGPAGAVHLGFPREPLRPDPPGSEPARPGRGRTYMSMPPFTPHTWPVM